MWQPFIPTIREVKPVNLNCQNKQNITEDRLYNNRYLEIYHWNHNVQINLKFIRIKIICFQLSIHFQIIPNRPGPRECHFRSKARSSCWCLAVYGSVQFLSPSNIQIHPSSSGGRTRKFTWQSLIHDWLKSDFAFSRVQYWIRQIESKEQRQRNGEKKLLATGIIPGVCCTRTANRCQSRREKKIGSRTTDLWLVLLPGQMKRNAKKRQIRWAFFSVQARELGLEPIQGFRNVGLDDRVFVWRSLHDVKAELYLCSVKYWFWLRIWTIKNDR